MKHSSSQTLGKMKNTHSIEYTIEYKEPLEVTVFTNSLTAFSNEYKKFVSDNYEGQHPSEAKLFIEKIEDCCLKTTLVEYATAALPFLSDTNTIVDFGNTLAIWFAYFRGGRKSEKPNIDVASMDNLQKILAPATYHDNSTNIELKGDNNNIIVLKVSNEEANAMTNQILMEKKEVSEPTQNRYYKQAFYWENANRNMKSVSGNFGIIEGISLNKMSITFEDDDTKKEMIIGKEHPFRTTYIVDLEVQYVRGMPTIYKILTLHETINNETE